MSSGGVATRRRRGHQTAADMVRSLALVLLVVAVIVVITPRQWSDPTPEIDYSAELASGRRAAPYPLLAPVGLASEWAATSVRYRKGADDAVHWHLGFSTPAEEYVGLEQSNGPSAAFASEQTLHGRPAGETRVAGDVWQRRLRADEDRRSLVRVDDGVTTVVTGSGSWSSLAQLARSLRDRQG